MCNTLLRTSLRQITSNGRGLSEANIFPKTVFYVAKNWIISRNSTRKQYNRERKRTEKNKEEMKVRRREREKSHLLKQIGSRQTSRKRLVD